MSDFCKICNPHSSYHTTAIGECLVDIWFAEICQLTMCVFGSQSMLSKSTCFLYGSTASCRSIQCCMYQIGMVRYGWRTKICTSWVTLEWVGSGEDVELCLLPGYTQHWWPVLLVATRVKSNTRWKTDIDKIVVDFLNRGALVQESSGG